MDHYFLKGAWAISKKNSCTAKTSDKKKIVQGEPWKKKIEQVLSTIEVQCLT